MDTNNTPAPTHHRWPEGAIVYQVYPRSLQDSNDDGVGDLPGIISRLDYLKDLGVNALWLSPFYPSPMADFGYDIADYCDVDPVFGTLNDFKRLLAESHDRGIKIIVDLVPNHTSDEHAWFKQSSSSRDNPLAGWYIWKDGRTDDQGNRLPPNNWLDALTGTSAWEWSESRQQYYLHSFHARQPDLNWNNREVRQAIKQVMRFWLDLGVDGFRVDAVYWMAKDPLYRDDAINPEYIEGEDPKYESLAHDKSRGWPALYAHLTEMAEVLQEAPYREQPRFMVTEAYPQRHNPIDTYMEFYAGMDPLVAAPFNFEGVELPWNAQDWHRFLKPFHCAISDFNAACVASYAFGNHDKPRLISRLGESAARSAAVMQFTLPGMIFVYYGEEIGMRNVTIPSGRLQDPNAVDDLKYGQGRDPARTPMQWSAAQNAGFSDAAETWLPVSADYQTVNVESESSDPDSFLSLYRTLAQLRNEAPAFRYGTIEVIDLHCPNLLAYIRKEGEAQYLTLINFSDELVTCRPDFVVRKLLVSSEPGTKLAKLGRELELLPHEGALFEM